MPTVSYDSKSLMVDGRRLFLVSGTIHYPRVPRSLWASRIAAAKQAGLNCVDVPVYWNVHEPRPSRFVFDGDHDLRHFIELIGQAGLYAALRPGPAVGAEWDFGGMPAWLNTIAGMALRQGSGPMLEAAARYLGAVMEQVRDLQASVPSPGRPQGGPIVLVQAENQWFCHNPTQADGYLREIIRFLRENGCNVPITLANNLWQQVDGAIDTWQGDGRLLAHLRQLQVIQPLAPRLVSQFRTGQPAAWGHALPEPMSPRTLTFRMVEMLAGGGQYNLWSFHGGTNFGFWGGEGSGLGQAFATTSHDSGAPLGEAGRRGPAYQAVKRVSTFASQFAHVLANLDPAHAHTAAASEPDDANLSVVHLHGDQGHAVFLLKGSQNRSKSIDLMLPHGVSLTVPLGDDAAAWLLLGVRIGSATLNYSSLRPWACLDRRMLVLFGPAGAEGVVCINEAPLSVTVPTGRKPLIEQHEDLTIVVLNEEMVDAAVLSGDKLVIGAAGLDERQQPLPLEGWSGATIVASRGNVSTQSHRRSNGVKEPVLGAWQQADVQDLIDGSSPAFTAMEGPASLESLKQAYGYGWYRLAFKGSTSASVLPPAGCGRLQIFTAGKSAAVLGPGPGGDAGPVDLKLGGNVTVLADHFGRTSFATALLEPRGLHGHLHAVRKVALGKPQTVAGRAPDVFELSKFVPFARKDDRPNADALEWSVKFAAKRPLILVIDDLPVRAMVCLDGKAIALYEPGQTGQYQLPGGAATGKLSLHLFQTLQRLTQQHKGLQVARHLTLWQSIDEPSAKAQWAFAPWQAPAAERFQPLPKRLAPLPRWYRATFTAVAGAPPLWLEPRGLSKGQIILNGRQVGRYFVATAAGKPVPPQSRYYLPEPWLLPEQDNELLLFDEHGKSPQNARLVYAAGPNEG